MYTVEYLKTPVYANEDHTMISCIVKFPKFDYEIPFAAYKDDIENHGREIYNDIITGKYGEIGAYVALPLPEPPPAPPAPTLESLQAQLAALTAQITALANTGS